MDDRTKVLVESLRAEAIAIFQVNQAARSAAERILALTFAVVGIEAAALSNGNTDLIALPLPSVICLLLSYMFQLYADVGVLGGARAELEHRVNQLLGEPVLIYETAVADVRKTAPMVRSLRAVQALAGAVLLATIGIGGYVAAGTRHAWIGAVYAVVTAFSFGSLLWSLRHERVSLRLGRERVRGALRSSPPISGGGDGGDAAAPSMATRVLGKSADCVSASRCILAVAAFAVIASTRNPSTGVVIACTSAVVGSVILDHVDGRLARRYGSASADGSYVDILSDHITGLAGWLLAATVSTTWLILAAVLIFRDAVVDSIKVFSVARGADMAKGIRVTDWRESVVHSFTARLVHNALKATALGAITLAVAGIGGFHTVADVAIPVFMVSSLLRALASILELPATLGLPRQSIDWRAVVRFAGQAALSITAFAVCVAGIDVYSPLR